MVLTPSLAFRFRSLWAVFLGTNCIIAHFMYFPKKIVSGKGSNIPLAGHYLEVFLVPWRWLNMDEQYELGIPK